MNFFIKFLEKIFNQINNKINDKIVGINYLEIIKIELIKNLKDMDHKTINDLSSEIKSLKFFSKKMNINSRNIDINISLFEESLTKIKHRSDHNILYVVLNGLNNITVFDKFVQNRSIDLKLIKNMGVVISENTILSENISKNSIILNIINN